MTSSRPATPRFMLATESGGGHGSDRVPEERVRPLNTGEVNRNGQYVLYWMTSFRRTRSNFALQRAVERAVEMGKGLLILEALRSDYRWASDRFHRFIIEGMADNSSALAGRQGVTYLPYVEGSIGEGRGLLGALADHASLVVTDDYPNFFIRRYLQKGLPRFLESVPLDDPLANLSGVAAPEIPPGLLDRWPQADLTGGGAELDLSQLPIDHSIGATSRTGGPSAAEAQLETFLQGRLSRYADERNQPEEEVASGLSPWLHFGHISTHTILQRLAEHEDWKPDFEGRPTDGKRSGWWGMSGPAEAFLDELVTWRELGYNMAANQPDYREYDSLPEWARETLAEHVDDPRPHTYSLEEFAAAETHDELWNAAQRQLVREGVIHNYLRMLWGKKILEWTWTPHEAADVMIELNNRYALDGRDPNSYSGIYWCLGRYDRPWGPERPIFGKIRYMTSKNTARKVRVGEYLERYSE
ncbi:MAG: deoxyribodipyrimidine photolyase [Gemmatimonadota bacterium]